MHTTVELLLSLLVLRGTDLFCDLRVEQALKTCGVSSFEALSVQVTDVDAVDRRYLGDGLFLLCFRFCVLDERSRRLLTKFADG